MELSITTFIIVCPLVFLAGLVDAIGGGGGLISLPAYLIAGLPVHTAVATNKLSSSCGTLLATIRFIKNGLVNFKLAVPSVLAAIVGSFLGARISLIVSEDVMKIVLIVVLPISAFLVLNKNLFSDKDTTDLVLNRRTYITAILSALVIGVYDGFYGPGTGTFLIIAFTVFAKINMKSSNAQAKVINLTTNLTSLCVFILNGKVLFTLGVAAAACNMVGGYIGAGLVMSQGAKLVRPSIILVLILLALKVVGVF
ncbi:MAG: TSUP family transporter [Lachnospiraceae bacterium]|jgi:uncharacterized membrane protein YfcA|nr:TSUP family transporter [Lachnospiraceae bacterium]MDD3614844.1 TSUP family transporter [Lachnospiraceae bacterium]